MSVLNEAYKAIRSESSFKDDPHWGESITLKRGRRIYVALAYHGELCLFAYPDENSPSRELTLAGETNLDRLGPSGVAAKIEQAVERAEASR